MDRAPKGSVWKRGSVDGDRTRTLQKSDFPGPERKKPPKNEGIPEGKRPQLELQPFSGVEDERERRARARARA
jgi:hypothetical protein